MKSTHRVTDAVFIEIIKESVSIRGVLIKCGLAPQGGNYLTIHNRIKKLQLDTSHFLGRGWSKSRKLPQFNTPLESYLTNAVKCTSYKLKQKLLAANILEAKCNICQLTLWNSKPIPLELHHIDGCKNNNCSTNLTLLCPNCHAQTVNYRGRNCIKNINL